MVCPEDELSRQAIDKVRGECSQSRLQKALAREGLGAV